MGFNEGRVLKYDHIYTVSSQQGSGLYLIASDNFGFPAEIETCDFLAQAMRKLDAYVKGSNFSDCERVAHTSNFQIWQGAQQNLLKVYLNHPDFKVRFDEPQDAWPYYLRDKTGGKASFMVFSKLEKTVGYVSTGDLDVSAITRPGAKLKDLSWQLVK